MRALLCAALIAAGGCSTAGEAVRFERTAVTCEESEPCWDCSTMGNRVCGPFAQMSPMLRYQQGTAALALVSLGAQ